MKISKYLLIILSFFYSQEAWVSYVTSIAQKDFVRVTMRTGVKRGFKGKEESTKRRNQEIAKQAQQEVDKQFSIFFPRVNTFIKENKLKVDKIDLDTEEHIENIDIENAANYIGKKVDVLILDRPMRVTMRFTELPGKKILNKIKNFTAINISATVEQSETFSNISQREYDSLVENVLNGDISGFIKAIKDYKIGEKEVNAMFYTYHPNKEFFFKDDIKKQIREEFFLAYGKLAIKDRLDKSTPLAQDLVALATSMNNYQDEIVFQNYLKLVEAGFKPLDFRDENSEHIICHKLWQVQANNSYDKLLLRIIQNKDKFVEKIDIENFEKKKRELIKEDATFKEIASRFKF